MQVKKSGSFTNMLKGSFSKKKKPVPVAQPVKEDDSPLAMVRQLSLSKMMEMEKKAKEQELELQRKEKEAEERKLPTMSLGCGLHSSHIVVDRDQEDAGRARGQDQGGA